MENQSTYSITKLTIIITVALVAAFSFGAWMRDTIFMDRLASYFDNNENADPDRFEDCGDGTVADRETSLRWEKKTGRVGRAVLCETTECLDAHDVNNLYEWSTSGIATDGGVFSDFLFRLKGPGLPDRIQTEFNPDCFAGRCDWRLPTKREIETILDCKNFPCLDPAFGPTAPSGYWTISSSPSQRDEAALGFFFNGYTDGVSKTFDGYVRAVRFGSCEPKP